MSVSILNQNDFPIAIEGWLSTLIKKNYISITNDHQKRTFLKTVSTICDFANCRWTWEINFNVAWQYSVGSRSERLVKSVEIGERRRRRKLCVRQNVDVGVARRRWGLTLFADESYSRYGSKKLKQFNLLLCLLVEVLVKLGKA